MIDTRLLPHFLRDAADGVAMVLLPTGVRRFAYNAADAVAELVDGLLERVGR